MNDESSEQIERQLAAIYGLGSPRELRAAVLASVNRELRASRWDLRLARASLLLVVLGIGLNASLGLLPIGAGSVKSNPRELVARQSLVNTAAAVAEVTDTNSARQIVRQLAEMTGRKLSVTETAAIEAAMRRTAARGAMTKG